MRQKRICLLLAVLLLLSALTGCGKKNETGEENPNDIDVSDAVSGETLTSGQAADDVFTLSVDLEKSLNPITTRSTLNQMVDNLVYDRLFEVDENFNVSSRILEDWYYSVNDQGGSTWVLTVKDGIQMHDGSLLTAEDIRYTISRIFTSGSKFYQQQLGGALYASTYQGQVYLSGEISNGLLPLRLSIPIIKSAENSIKENIPIGSGPYTYSEDLSCLQKFDGYEGAATLPVDTIYLRPYTDPESLITEYESALVDLVVNDPTSIYNVGYGGKNEKRVFPTTNFHFICFNSKSDFFQFEPYRQALNWLINRDQVAKNALDNAVTPTVLPIHPNSSLYDQTIADELSYDPARGLMELEKGGCRDLDGDGMLEYAVSGGKREIEINFVVCADSAVKVQAARQIAEQLESVGLPVHLRELTWNEYIAALTVLEDLDDDDDPPEWIWDMYYGEFVMTGDSDTRPLFSGDRKDNGPLNYGAWNLAGLEASVLSYLAATDEQRPDATKEMLQAVIENSVFIPVCFEKREAISHIGVIKGMIPNQYDLFSGIADWTIKLK